MNCWVSGYSKNNSVICQQNMNCISFFSGGKHHESQNNLDLKGQFWQILADLVQPPPQVRVNFRGEAGCSDLVQQNIENPQGGRCCSLGSMFQSHVEELFLFILSLTATCDHCLLPFLCALLCRLPLHSSRLQLDSPFRPQPGQTQVPQHLLVHDVV